jgi:hypothetical protein
MKNTKIAFILAVIAVVLMAPSVSFAITTQDDGTGAATPSPLPVQDDGTGAATPTIPSGGSQDDGTGAGTPVPAPVTPPSSGGNSSGGSSSSSGGHSGGSRVILPTNCQLIVSTLKAGDVSLEVTKLQTFLKNTEKLNVTITGVYDAQTIEAVKAFQTKYADVVLAPWGITTPTGNVYMTTLKKINSLACGTALTITPAELAQINAYKNVVVNGTAPVTISNEVGTTVTPETSPSVEQTAAVAKTPFFSKVWHLIKRVFGR